MDLPTGYSVDTGGQFESQQRAQERLSACRSHIAGTHRLLLYFAFGTMGQAVDFGECTIAVMAVLWLSMCGDILIGAQRRGFHHTVWCGGTKRCSVESINQRITDGHAVNDAVFDGAWPRLRRVLMTAITSALGLIPMLFATGAGAEIQRPLATVIVGGLVSATLLTLVILPVLYPWFSKQKLRI